MVGQHTHFARVFRFLFRGLAGAICASGTRAFGEGFAPNSTAIFFHYFPCDKSPKLRKATK